MEVMNAARGGHGFQALDWPLADGACFLSSVGLPQLEHAVLGEPVDLTGLEGIVLSPTKKELVYLCVSGRESPAHALGRRRWGAQGAWGCRDRDAGGVDRDVR